MSFLANSHAQPLAEHLLGVGLAAKQLIGSFGFEPSLEIQFKRAAFLAGIFHDIGKVDPVFQKFIRIKKSRDQELQSTDAEAQRKNFDGPYHNEISWWLLASKVLRPPVDSYADDLLRHAMEFSVFWHHPAAVNKEGRISRDRCSAIAAGFSDRQELILNATSSIFGELRSLAKEYPEELDLINGIYLNSPSDNDLATPDYQPNLKQRDQRWVKQYAYHRLILNTLVEADRQVSAWSAQQLREFLNCKYQAVFYKPRSSAVEPRVPDSNRTRDQLTLATEMREHASPVVACGIDPGGGKTRIGLFWWSQSDSRPLLVALPRQVQVTGLFQLIEKEIQAVFEHSEAITCEGIFSGARQHQSPGVTDNQLLFSCDLVITTFDRFLSPNYRRDNVSEFIRMMQSDLILDEFHEFSTLHLMRPALKEILYLRSLLKNGGRTLLLSGTPDPSLTETLGIGSERIFSRERLPASVRRILHVRLSDATDESLGDFCDADHLWCFNTVESTQRFFLSLRRENGSLEPEIVHSALKPGEARRRIGALLNRHANNIECPLTLSSKMLQSSYDLNFRGGVFFSSLPNVDIQSLGRVNRFGNKEGHVRYVIDPNDANVFQENKFGFSELHDLWKKHLARTLKEPVSIEFREFVKRAYDEFWSKETIERSKVYLVRSEVSLHDQLLEMFPRRSQSSKKNATRSYFSFRGRSWTVSSRIVDHSLRSIGQLKDDDLISISKTWEIKPLREIGNGLATKLKGDDRFNVDKYRPPNGIALDRPFFYSHDNQKIDEQISEQLSARGIRQKVYREDIGLVPIDILNEGLPESSSKEDSKPSPGPSSSTGKRLVRHIDEMQPLVSLRRRVPIYYLERARLKKKEEGIRAVFLKDGVRRSHDLPVASIGMLLLGPGVSITSEAFRVIAARGCILGIAGGLGAPLYCVSTQHRSPKNRLQQMGLVSCPKKRLQSAIHLMTRRLDFMRQFGKAQFPHPPPIAKCESIEQLLSIEENWMKFAYCRLAKEYGVDWHGKRALSPDGKNSLIFLNHLSYSIADLVILHLGFDPNIGTLHGRTKGGGLSYDLADVVKPVLCLELGFTAAKAGVSLSELKKEFMANVVKLDAIEYLTKTLTQIMQC